MAKAGKHFESESKTKKKKNEKRALQKIKLSCKHFLLKGFIKSLQKLPQTRHARQIKNKTYQMSTTLYLG